MSGYRCHAKGCLEHVARKMLMCRPHWFKVPKRLRDEVWAHYRTGQERGDRTPSREWHAAADAAIAAVASQERRG